jgi:hypothetical protein
MRSKSQLKELIAEVAGLNIVYIVDLLKFESIILGSTFDVKNYLKWYRV